MTLEISNIKFILVAYDKMKNEHKDDGRHD